MKKKHFTFLVILQCIITNGVAQTYHPLPTQNAYWTVYEWDENQWIYDDKVYTVDGDTLVNSLTYTKVYQLNDHPTIYDTTRNLRCLMRQDIATKKIWFIRTYLGESTEKLGYDLSVNVGDTVSLPAFGFPLDSDSVFFLGTKHPDFVAILPNGIRTYYGFSSVLYPGRTISYIEGITCMSNTFPDREFNWDPFHQSYTQCVHQNNVFVWPASTFPIDSIHCGFNFVNIKDIKENTLNIYPIPAKEFCVIELPKSINNIELSILDLLGKPVLYLKPLASEFVNLDVSKIPSGIYLLTLKAPNQTFTNKLIVQH